MDNNFPFLMFGAFIVLAIVFLAMKIRADAKRREELFGMCTRLNLEYYQEDILRVASMYEGFNWLSVGDSRKASNVMSGKMSNLDFKMFDYRYSTGSGKSRTTHYLSLVVVDLDVHLQKLFIRPENVLDRVAGVIGFDDIDFESEEFSRAFYVKSPDKKFAYDIIHPRMMEFLLANRGWSLEMLGRSVMVCNGRTLKPEEFLQAATFLKEFVGLFPEYLWQALRRS